MENKYKILIGITITSFLFYSIYKYIYKKQKKQKKPKKLKKKVSFSDINEIYIYNKY